MMKTLVFVAFAFGALSQAGYAQDFPHSALAGMSVAHSVVHAPTEAQSLRSGFPALAPVGAAASSAAPPSHDVYAGSIDFPGAAETSSRVQEMPFFATTARRGKLQANRLEALSLR